VTTEKFRGKVAVVTGSASGVGRGIVTAFAREGARCVLADVDQHLANILADNLRSEGGDVVVSLTDVSKSGQVATMMEAALKAYGRVDVLVNCAGVYVHGEVADLAEQDWDYQMDVQLKGAFLCSRAAARQMIRQGGGGRIINIGSTAAGNARPQAAAHCASKAAVVMLSQVMALELGEYNITVNCVSPGLTDIAAISTHGATPEYIETFLTMVPLDRLARPEEIANMVLFLASDDAAFVSGQNIFVDGGYSAGKLSIRGPHRSERE
jgi:NAD(P)-dependent dehydrogenase (short-subunit alcohol dehydrogenase family)